MLLYSSHSVRNTAHGEGGGVCVLAELAHTPGKAFLGGVSGGLVTGWSGSVYKRF